MKLKGIGSIPKLPPMRESPVDAHPLTEKESKELKPKMIDIVQTVFRYVDMGITWTNRAHAEAYIWQTVDPSDCEVIADLLIESGKTNRLVATAVRRLSIQYKLLQVGLIALPRFIQTVQHYSQHGGFALNLMNLGGQAHATQNQRPDLSSRPASGGGPSFKSPAVQEK